MCFSFCGTLSPRPATGAPPWIPLGDFRLQDPLACAVLKFPSKKPCVQKRRKDDEDGKKSKRRQGENSMGKDNRVQGHRIKEVNGV